jgi:hypothetical protein
MGRQRISFKILKPAQVDKLEIDERSLANDFPLATAT